MAMQPSSTEVAGLAKPPSCRLPRWTIRLIIACGMLLTVGLGAAQQGTAASGTQLHYAANGNFDENSVYLPGRAGFNLADVQTLHELRALPDGVRGLVWVGQCNGTDAAFIQSVAPFIGEPKVFGFYLMDDPDPRTVPGLETPSPRCPAENLKAESDWLHARMPETKTFIVLMNMSSAATPLFRDTYNPETSHIDLYGLAAFPCWSDTPDCDYRIIDRYVAAAEVAGIPTTSIVPIFQAFGAGNWLTDTGAHYKLPSPAEEWQIITRWRTLVRAAAFDFTYSWGSQNSDLALHDAPELQAVLLRQNKTAPSNSPPH